MGAARKEVPPSLKADVTASQLGLPRSIDIMKCCDSRGHVCKQCVKPLKHKRALQHCREGTLPSCPAHARKEAGWKHLQAVLGAAGIVKRIVHQVPLCSEGSKGRVASSKRARHGQYCKGPDTWLDAEVTFDCPTGDKHMGVELHGREHRKLAVQQRDFKRITTAESRRSVSVAKLWLTNQGEWHAQVLDALHGHDDDDGM